MEKANKGKFYKLFWLWNIVRHGLFLQGLRNRFARIGLDVMPYYWTEENVEEFKAPEIRGGSEGFSISYFGEEEIMYIQNSISVGYQDLLVYFNEGQTCVGLKYNDEIAACMFIKKNDYVFRGKTFKLKDNEAYLHSMYTFEAFRGRNIAPYLRYHCYELAKGIGLNKTYSISEYFNKSSRKFKKKLNSKNTELYLSIVLFKKFKKNFLLKTYK